MSDLKPQILALVKKTIGEIKGKTLESIPDNAIFANNLEMSNPDDIDKLVTKFSQFIRNYNKDEFVSYGDCKKLKGVDDCVKFLAQRVEKIEITKLVKEAINKVKKIPPEKLTDTATFSAMELTTLQKKALAAYYTEIVQKYKPNAFIGMSESVALKGVEDSVKLVMERIK